jgi:hypothetical protein
VPEHPDASGVVCLAVPVAKENPMGIPNDTVTENEIEEKRREEAREESREARRRKLEKALDTGLEETFPASDPPNITQPPHSPLDKKLKE